MLKKILGVFLFIYNNKIKRIYLYYIFIFSLLLILAFTGLASLNYINITNQKYLLSQRIDNINQKIEHIIFDRFMFVDENISKNNALRRVLKTGGKSGISTAMTVIETVKSSLNASLVYLMDKKGFVLVSTTYDNNLSLIGNNYAFRQYFKSAIQGKKYIDIALGTTTKKRGIYFSAPVYTDEAEPSGVIVIKENLETIDNIFQQSSILIFLITDKDIVFAAPEKKYLFKPLPIAENKALVEHFSMPNFWLHIGDRYIIEGKEYFATLRPFPLKGWKYIAFAPVSNKYNFSARQKIFILLTVVIVLSLIIIIFGLFNYLYRWRKALHTIDNERTRLKIILETTVEGFLQLDPYGRVLDVNPAMCDILNVSSSDIIGQSIFQYINPANEIILKKQFDLIKRERRSFKYEIALQQPSGDEIICMFKATPVFSIDEFKGIFAMVSNITEQTAITQRLSENEEKFRSITEQLMMAVIIIRNNRITDVNTAAARILDEKLEDIKNEKISFLYRRIHPDDFEYVMKSYNNLFFSNSIDHIEKEFRIRTKKGEVKIIQEYAKKIFYNGGFSILLSAIDISLRKRTEESLVQLNEKLETMVAQRTAELEKQKKALSKSLEEVKRAQNHIIQTEKMASLGGLVAGISHEVNNPIGVCVTASSFMEESVKKISEQYRKGNLTKSAIETFFNKILEASKLIQTNLKKADDLMKSFKNIAVDRTSGEKRKFNLKNYLGDILLSLKPEFRKGDFTVELKILDNIEIDSYPGVFSQIFTNLIINSMIHGFENRKEGKIKISATLEDNILHIIYSDNGKGIDNDKLDKIFEPFFTTKRGQGGSGLGLNIVYNLVTNVLSGTINCRNMLENGVEFHIRMPIIK